MNHLENTILHLQLAKMKKKKRASLLFRRQFANMIESYAAIVSIPTYDIKEYAKAAIRDIFIQMPSRSVTYENWGGFKQYVVSFFGEDSYNIAMEELLREKWITEGETRYEWRKMYGPVGTIPKYKAHLNEWADSITTYENGKKKKLSYKDDDAYPFTYDVEDKRLYLGGPRDMHGKATHAYDVYNAGHTKMNGRVWIKEKILSLWTYPKTKSDFDELLEKLNWELEFKSLPKVDYTWKFDLPVTEVDLYNTNRYDMLDDEHYDDQTYEEFRDITSVLIPINQWRPDAVKNPKQYLTKNSNKTSNKRFSVDKKYADKVGPGYNLDDVPAFVKHGIERTSDSVIKDKPVLENKSQDDYKDYIPKLSKFMIEKGMKIVPLPKVKIRNNEVKNSESIFGKTAHYDRDLKEITLFTLDRHPKDILRSFAHEMVHHEQNLKGLLNNINSTNTNEDDYMEEFEKEAYEKGNIMLRNWEDNLKQNKQSLNEIQTEYGCLMLKIDFPGWDKFVNTYIKNGDLYDNAAHEYGYEHEAHITILYGFHEDADVKKIKQIVQSLKNEIRITTDKINIFATKDFDVVKFEVKSPILTKLNEIMKKNFKYTSNHNDYKAHMTIAYVKHGLGEKYSKNLNKIISLSSGTFIYSYPGGRKEEFSIKKIE